MNKVVVAPIVAEGMTVEPLYILGILSGAGMVIAFLFRQLISAKDQLIAVREREVALIMAQKDAAIAELISVKKSHQEMATDAIRSATEMANFVRSKEGKPPIIPIAPVISESHSPSTEKQRETALIATMRAQMALIRVKMGQEPRQEPEQAVEPMPPTSVVVSAPAPYVAGAATTEEVMALTRKAASLEKEIVKAPDVIAKKVVERIEEHEEGKS